MPHVITQGPHPNIMVIDISGELAFEDMMAVEELGLDKGSAIYVLLDGSKMTVGLPEKFLENAQKSFFVHPNLGHMALFLESKMLRTIAVMVAKLTRRQTKLTLHDSREAAMAHLLELVKKAGL